MFLNLFNNKKQEQENTCNADINNNQECSNVKELREQQLLLSNLLKELKQCEKMDQKDAHILATGLYLIWQKTRYAFNEYERRYNEDYLYRITYDLIHGDRELFSEEQINIVIEGLNAYKNVNKSMEIIKNDIKDTRLKIATIKNNLGIE